MDPTQRFTERVENYARFRPSYPEGIIDLLLARSILRVGDVVADVGSGTGKLTELFLRRGHTVIGVEPNARMRTAGEVSLKNWPGFRSVEGRAEATGLPAASVDVVTAGQAFHWFDPEAARGEFLRILKPGGRVVLVWNDRVTEGSAFMEGYEAFLRAHGTDYAEVRSKDPSPAAVGAFFGTRGYERAAVRHHQDLDFAGLRGRLLSSSYVPQEGGAGFDSMMLDLEWLWKTHVSRGRVRFIYDAMVWFGTLDDQPG
jgi:SAM-dependent methyltransferase